MKNSLYLSAYEDGTDRVFGNVSIQNSDAGELPRREHTTYRTRRKFEIKRNFLFILLKVLIIKLLPAAIVF